MSLKGRNLINTLDFSIQEQKEVFSLANEMITHPKEYAHILDGKILATLFYEPSTRTRLSFEAAMMRLGGKAIGFADANSSSVSKGETISDTIRIVSSYADMAVLRHPKEGAPSVAAAYSSVPVINAGDGGREHPTQTLSDLMTIQSLKGSISNLTVGCCGDLKFGRTVHSLIKNLSRYPSIKFIFVSPDELKLPSHITEYLNENKIKYEQMTVLEDAIKSMDILYMTRVQQERFFNEEDYIRLKDMYILDQKKLQRARTDLTIMHPLPRVNEIAFELDQDPRSAYFKQARYGMFVRMSLIANILAE